MPLPDLTRKEAEEVLSRFCEQRVPLRARGQVQLSFGVRGNTVTLYESRPAFLEPDRWTRISVAQFRFDPASNRWTLYCADRNSRWHEYLDLGPSRRLERLVREVDDDPTGIFWG